MEFSATGGILLLVIVVLWVGFMTPTGKQGLLARREVKEAKKIARRAPALKPKTTEVTKVNNPWFVEEKISEVESVKESKEPVEKIVVNRLPDPLSARLGKIEDVQWAEIVELNDARNEKEKISSETLDEIMRRRRSNG